MSYTKQTHAFILYREHYTECMFLNIPSSRVEAIKNSFYSNMRSLMTEVPYRRNFPKYEVGTIFLYQTEK